MAYVPKDAIVLELEQALRHHKTWTTHDRDLVRAALEAEYPGHRRGDPIIDDLIWTEDWPVALYWYIPPSGAYVAGHDVQKTRYSRAEMNRVSRETGRETLTSLGIEPPQNRVFLKAGYVILRADTPAPARIELSSARRVARGNAVSENRLPEVCPECFLAHAGECP